MCIRNNCHNTVHIFEYQNLQIRRLDEGLFSLQTARKGRAKTSVTIFYALAGTLGTVTVLLVLPQGITLKVKRPESEADHPPPSTAEVKNQQSYTFFPPTGLQLNLFTGHTHTHTHTHTDIYIYIYIYTTFCLHLQHTVQNQQV